MSEESIPELNSQDTNSFHNHLNSSPNIASWRSGFPTEAWNLRRARGSDGDPKRTGGQRADAGHLRPPYDLVSSEKISDHAAIGPADEQPSDSIKRAAEDASPRRIHPCKSAVEKRKPRTVVRTARGSDRSAIEFARRAWTLSALASGNPLRGARYPRTASPRSAAPERT